ncbi:ribosomal protein L7/L12 [bacterium]|nr:ribosomal protein L7/L12 [bacterium]
MSPDRSVHDEQLAEIDRNRVRRPVWRRRLGCLVFLLLISGALAYVYRDRLRVLVEPETYERLAEKSGEVARIPPRDVLQSLREKTAAIQSKLENRTEPGSLREDLEALREEIARKSQATGKTLQRQWEELTDETERLVEEVRDKTKDVDREGLRQRLGALVGRLDAMQEGLDLPLPERPNKRVSVLLVDLGENPDNVVAAVRDLNPILEEKEARELVEDLPAALARDVSSEQADRVREQIEAAGGRVRVQSNR